MDDIFDMRKEALSIINSMEEGDQGYSTGLPCLDSVIGGYKDGEFIIIAGNTSMGKSSLSRVSALDIAKENTVLLVSLEMGSRELSELALTSLAGLNYTEVMQEELTSGNRKKLEVAAKSLQKRNLLIWDSSYVSPELLDSKITEINKQEKVDCVIVDYLQLMTTAVKENRQVEIATISRELKLMAIKYNIPVIALSQLNRACEQRDDKRPKISDLRDSGALGQDVDKCILIHRPAYYDVDQDDDGVAELIVAKNRKGPRNITVAVGWVAERMMFYDMEQFDDF